MNKRIVGILIVGLLLATILPIAGVAKNVEDQQTEVNDDTSKGIWFVRGFLKYVEEDEDYVYLRVIAHTSIFGLGEDGGIAKYSIFGLHPLKFAKPFRGFLPKGVLPMFAIGMCNEWGPISE